MVDQAVQPQVELRIQMEIQEEVLLFQVRHILLAAVALLLMAVMVVVAIVRIEAVMMVLPLVAAAVVLV